MRIFLTGFMAAGKTTVGRRLSKILDLDFMDLDSEIEKVTGITISEWFRQKGESEFRKMESEVLHSLTEAHAHAVISTGGGAPCFHGNMKFMNERGITIYLKLPPRALVSRLSDSKGSRPLIEDMNAEELTDYIEKTLATRDPFYNNAEIIADGLSVDVDGLAEKVLQTGRFS
jgi:shikimate kinase